MGQAALQSDDTARMHHLLGQAHAAANRPDDAERVRAALERGPLLEVYAFDLRTTATSPRRFRAAATLKAFGRSAQMQLAFGVAAYGQRRFADAIDAFLRVTTIDPSVEQPYVFLARILDQADDRLPQVVAAFAAWEKAEPANYLAVCLHAKALSVASGDASEIEAKLRRSIQLNDAYWESHFELTSASEWKQAVTEHRAASI
jgi:tetratricopeptide (TPR) repeat protein